MDNIFPEQPVVECWESTTKLILDPGETNRTTGRLNPFQQLFAIKPRLHHYKSSFHFLCGAGQDLLSSAESLGDSLLIKNTATNANLLFGYQGCLLKLLVGYLSGELISMAMRSYFMLCGVMAWWSN
ncbi:hypothetical protein N7451_010311 [Penicillium sp. IBT 35674x]|nr:hypothetical protein N7451_010311 [Penicillium sp. IBT 35674x]